MPSIVLSSTKAQAVSRARNGEHNTLTLAVSHGGH